MPAFDCASLEQCSQPLRVQGAAGTSHGKMAMPTYLKKGRHDVVEKSLGGPLQMRSGSENGQRWAVGTTFAYQKIC